MRAIRPPDVTGLGLNLAPMVDVMMCLLIFFLLATKMAERENVLIDLPTAASASEARRAGDRSDRLVVNVVAATADEVMYVVDARPLALNDVVRRLEAAAGDSRLECYIRADRSVPYRTVEPLLLHCARLGIARVTFAADMSGETQSP
jgi:biopolymer transport protein ExbD